MSSIVEPALIGLLIGFLPAVVGGIISYLWFFRRQSEDKSGVLILIVSTTATLVIIGAIAVIVGVISGELKEVIITGIGVFFGFALGFGLMIAMYLRMFPSDDGELQQKTVTD